MLGLYLMSLSRRDSHATLESDSLTVAVQGGTWRRDVVAA